MHLGVVQRRRAALDGDRVLVPLDVGRAAHRLLPPAVGGEVERRVGDRREGRHRGRGPVHEDPELGVVVPGGQRAGTGFHQTSTIRVTGPSLTSATAMSVRKRPVATIAPSSSQPVDDGVDERLGLLRAGGGEPRRSATLGGVAVERELRDHQQRGADVGGRPVHHAVGVVEDPQVPELVGQLGRGGGVVVVGDADQHAEPGADRPRPPRRPRSPTRSSPAARPLAWPPNLRRSVCAQHRMPVRSAHRSAGNLRRPGRSAASVASATVGAIDVNGVACRTPGGVDLLERRELPRRRRRARGAGRRQRGRQDDPVPGHRRRPGAARPAASTSTAACA